MIGTSALRSSVVLAAIGAAAAVSVAFGASSAFADPANTIDCQPGQVVVEGQCISAQAPTTTQRDSNDSGHH